MFVPEKNKLNKFKLVRIPKNREYFSRFGAAVAPAAQYTGDDDPGLVSGRKIDQIADMAAYDEYMIQKESEK